MCNQKSIVALLTASLFLLSGVVADEGVYELGVEDLKNVARSMRLAEDALLNVRVDSNSWVEQGPSSSGPWQRTPVCFSTCAFFGGISNSRARIDFHKHVSPWKNGAAPYIEESCSVGFDGVQSRHKAISTSHSGKTFDRSKGTILTKEPVELRGCGRITGIGASLFLYHRNASAPFPKRFSTHFQAAADPNRYLAALAAADPNYANVKPDVEFKAFYQKLGEIECIRMAYIGNSFRKDWWFDPSRAFALLRHENIRTDPNGNGQVSSSINVTKLKEVAENIWWPMEARFLEAPSKIGKPWKRIVYKASNVSVNDLQLPEDAFTVRFPDGYLIDDKVKGTKYIVGREQKGIEE